jgi:hydroxymethylbilane synthase
VADGDDGPELWLRAVVTAIDGSDLVRLSASGVVDHAEALGAGLARDMLTEGAASLMQERAS